MSWRRLGRVFCPENNFEWMASHAANPFAEPVGESLWRIYFSPRDRDRRSAVCSLLFDAGSLSVIELFPRPILSPGEAGSFDDSGVSLGCIVANGRDRYLYYVGWNLAVTVPFRNSIGLAVSLDGKEYVKHAAAPVLDRSSVDPLSLSYPWVLKQGAIWKMWYGSTLRWREDSSDQDHVIKYAQSSDGIHWTPTGDTCIGVQSDTARAFSRPCVVFDGELYRMWFSFRGERYSIGYAESKDGINWKVLPGGECVESAGDGWESESVAYPHVFNHAGRRYMLYCGNRYGETGFGLAVWE